MKKPILLLYFTLVLNMTAFGVVHPKHYVKSDGNDVNNGETWETAKATLTAAINDATFGNQVWVAAGTYKPSSAYSLTNSSRYYHFEMKNDVAIYGGFAGTESSLSERNISANVTILSGDIGIVDVNTDNCYHVFYHPSGLGLTSTAILDGFTIKRGNANSSAPHNYGGGIYNYSNSPTIRNCTISDNAAASGGGNFNDNASNPSFINCLFSSNSASYGGGIYNYTSSRPAFINCVFSSNSASVYGGGMVNSGEGSASGNTTITNCTFSSNSASSYGGGMYNVNYLDHPTINNSIIWGNTASTGGKQIYIGSYTTLNYTCISNGTNDIGISGGSPVFNNTIYTDPQFATASSYPYNIYGTSPCTDAGLDSYISESYDIRGSSYPRKLNKTDGSSGTVDMGAYEYKYATDYYNEDGSLPVTLSNFSAKVISSGVALNWSTESEIENLGFNIYRKSGGEDFNLIVDYRNESELEGYGSTTEKHDYQFTDNAIQLGMTYTYLLSDVNYAGVEKKHTNKTATVTIPANQPGIAEGFHLGNVYPNPFNATFTIPLTLGKSSPVKITLCDLNGKVVKEITDGIKPAGEYRIPVDCRNLSSGIYLLQSKIQESKKTMKVVLVK